MGTFIKSNLQQVKNRISFRVLERLLPNNIEVEGKEMDVVDYGSRTPISEGNQREFRISNNDIGIKVKTNRVRRLNVRDIVAFLRYRRYR